eukprot:CAMPEP_0172544392 /NCGR_PEP_ID=MMETSP1067-20121228/14564_1 /TAXON_ID=265564 ORGANISM="Thalassiosira punctigera, Strain Tpunct2005C2" /NCGR_SAMPLE_ID=MMETSP1067 /ASSEMBLY_ACC=CAM_ASM_000444 /LENGTH=446 /DNA_ID=CAMNT_0013330951 /DNA_START=503 /DNA_END=1841 /DNA_ORIENTATION=+
MSCSKAGSPKQKDSGREDIANYEEKEYVRDKSKLIVEAITYTNKERFEKSCGPNERVLQLRFTTDKYGYETSFELQSAEGGVIASGPGANRNYADETTYIGQYCVKIGLQYRLRMRDANGDGFCCNFGQGTYSLSIEGQTIYDSQNKKTFSKVGTQTFRVKAPPSRPPNNPNGLAIGGKADSGTGCVTVEAKADKHADELSWVIINDNGNQVGLSPALEALEPVSKKICLPPGQYKFEMRDKYGDGMCCGSGDGYFIIYLDGKEIARGAHFSFKKGFTVQVSPAYESNMPARDREWLDSHNTRREKYHAEFGVSYVPLQWSPELASQSKRWATKQLDGCNVDGVQHETGIEEGENLAKNKGTGSFGSLRSTESILTRWVENERHDGYPRNAHLTQVLWRASKYLGCGEAEKPLNGGKGTCRVQVCRYARAGNCNMNHYKATVGNNW